MARVPLIEEQDHRELEGLIEKIKSGRGTLLNIYRLLLHSPAVTEAWMGLIDAIRRGTVLDRRSRELAILRVAAVNRSAYERKQHVPRIALSMGVSLQECEAVERWPQKSSLSGKDEAVIAYADAVSRDVHVEDAVVERLKPHFSPREIVELTIVIAVYNMHGRVVEPLKVDLEPD